MKLNDMDKALADYSEAYQAQAERNSVLHYRSYIYEIKGDLKNSMADTEKVLKARSEQSGGEGAQKTAGPEDRLRATPLTPAATLHRRLRLRATQHAA